MCPEGQRELVCEVYVGNAVCEIALLSVEIYVSFPQGARSITLHFGGCRVIAWPHVKEETPHYDLSYGCDEVGVMFNVNVEQ